MKNIDKIIYTWLANELITDENTIKLSESNILKLDTFVKNIVNKKKDEAHHKVDFGNEARRWRTGMGGELALEQFLDKKFVDLSIGDSNDYHVADLSSLNLNVGVKTVEYGKYPVIFKQSKKPEIIIIRISDDTFSILGLGLSKDLNKYQDDSHILSPALLARGTKTAFVGFYKLKPFNNFDELNNLL
jgi:hypothetical protein